MWTLSRWIIALCATVGTAHAQTQDPALPRPMRYDLSVRVDVAKEQLDATASVLIRNEHKEPINEASFLLYRLMSVRDVRDAKGASLAFTQSVVGFDDFKKLQVNHVRIPLVPSLPPGGETKLEIRYGGYLMGYVETGMLYIKDRIDSAYTLLREDAYAYPIVAYPSLGARRRAGFMTYEYTATITVPSTHTVANGGALIARKQEGPNTTFVYRSIKPSWRMDFAIAPFGTLRRGNLTVFYLPADSAGALRIIDAMEKTLALYTRWFGPLHGESPYSVIEIPDGWGSQADVTSLLQAAAAFHDPKREYELYHEISHLWNPPSADKPSPRWNEGLASFLEDLTTDSLFGSATTDSSALRLARWLAERVRRDSTLIAVPPIDYGKRNMTDYSYSVSSLMFFGLYRRLGHATFARLIGEYYRSYSSTQGSTADFVRLAKSLGTVDLTSFFDDWLYSTKWAAVVTAAHSASDLYAKN